MKIKYLLIAVLAGAALVGCNREPGVEDLKENGKHSYMGFTISTPPATKAENTGATGSFQKGEDFENWINTIYFFFYKDGAYVSYGYGEVGKDFKPEDNTDEIEEILHDGSTEKNGVVVMESTMTMPNQVLCVINTRNPNFYRNKPLADVLASLQTGSAESLTGNAVDAVRNASTKPEIDFWYEYTDATGKKPYFVMLTAPMMGKNKNGKYEIKYVTDIPEGAIKETREAAKQNPIEVYVERMAARLEISNLASIVDADGFFKAANFGPDMLNAGVPEYDIKPIAWSVTAVNQKGNILKKADLSWWDTTTNPALPVATGPFAGWLESGTQVPNTVQPGTNMFPRINWALDPNYNDPAVTNRNHYPHSARELFDGTEPNELKYYSANEVKANYQDGSTDDANEYDVRQRYAYENTFGQLGQNDPRIPGTMILLTAQAKKHGSATDPFVDLYAYLGQINNFAEYAAHVVGSLDANGFTFYLNADMTDKLSDFDFVDTAAPNYKDPTTLFEVKKATKYINMFSNNEASWKDLTNINSSVDPTKKMPQLYNNWVIELEGTIQPNAYDSGFGTDIPAFTAEQVSGYADGYVTLVPMSGVTLYLEDPAHVTDPTVTPACKAATPAQIAQAFLGSVIEPANRYEKGLMYYAIPIEHFGNAYTGTDPNKVLLEGNYGVVRNNLYQVEINKINTLGHGIDDPDEPIVPGDRKKTLYIAAKINILSWQIVSQSADLVE